ncbi:MAG: SAM-dependent methyltransferase, partial [Thermoleophilia bacterium]|nr:SAM-dependent methyltransferase [Thermoleophilia bacterium]
MQPATSLDGQGNLPRYFARVFAIAQRLERGRLDFVIPDGRRFRVEGARPGPAAELDIHDGELFARLIREGDLGFCEAYLDGGWTTPDLMAFMDLLHDGNDTVLDGYPAMRLAWAWETLRH